LDDDNHGRFAMLLRPFLGQVGPNLECFFWCNVKNHTKKKDFLLTHQCFGISKIDEQGVCKSKNKKQNNNIK